MLVNTHLLWSNVTRKQETKRNNSSSFDEFVQFSKYSWLDWIMYTFYYAAWWRHLWWWSLFTGLRTWWNILLRFRSLILTLLWPEIWEYLVFPSTSHQRKQRVIVRTLVRTKQVQLPYFLALLLKMILPTVVSPWWMHSFLLPFYF
jgi:hypothetical protein